MTVAEMILKLLKRFEHDKIIPAETAIDSINGAVRYLQLRMADRNSDLVKGTFVDTGMVQEVALPSDFNGFAGSPTIAGRRLDPLPPDVSQMSATDSVPTHYDVVGYAMFLYPEPTTEVTVSAKYWVFPETLRTSDDIPFDGMFDGLILATAALFAVNGAAVLSQQAFMAGVEQGLDLVLFPRKPGLPSRRPYNGF